MGEISKKLAKMIRSSRTKKVVQLREYAEGKQLLRNKNGVKDVRELVDKGYDPLHAVYVSAQNLVSILSEILSELPLFKGYYDKVAYAEDEYLPGGPPMSPLTMSYFTAWAFFDAQFGKDNETLGSCILDVGKELKLSPDMIEVIGQFQDSRMGIYRRCGKDGNNVVLKEIVSDEEFSCNVGSRYSGKKGQLWFVRRLPPVQDSFDYSVIFTTPYVFIGTSIKEWLQYIDRTLPKTGINDNIEALNQFMKYGLETNYWNEYILLAYHHAQHDAIFLTGIPDIRSSLPHAD
jgi:hypothetical protein